MSSSLASKVVWSLDGNIKGLSDSHIKDSRAVENGQSRGTGTSQAAVTNLDRNSQYEHT